MLLKYFLLDTATEDPDKDQRRVWCCLAQHLFKQLLRKDSELSRTGISCCTFFSE